MRKVFAFSITGAACALAFVQPAAAQDTCVAGPFMVFFDANSDQLSPQAKAILDNAATAYSSCGQAQVMIAGHTDRKGADQYNVGLSQRIAASVRRYLATRGIPDGVMTTEAFGESRPLVETLDGVGEPQNRRAEITFGPGSGWRGEAGGLRLCRLVSGRCRLTENESSPLLSGGRHP